MTFDVGAAAYDSFMGRYSVLLAPQLADLARPAEGQRALDVGCGTGALTAELAGRLGASSVSAVDPSASFVASVRERYPGVDVRLAGAERLPFSDHSFDATLAQLVVHFMSDPVAGLAEMSRVTRSGGVVAACVWDHAGGHGPLSMFWDAVRDLDPDVQDESTLPGTREGHLEALMREGGPDVNEGTARDMLHGRMSKRVNEKKVNAVLRDASAQLVSEIRTTIDFYRENDQGGKLGRIVRASDENALSNWSRLTHRSRLRG